MNILTLPLRTLRRKLSRTLLLTVVFASGICSVVALNYVSAAVGESMEKKLMAYGANIVLKPKVDTLSVDYGGLGLGNVSLEVKLLTQEQVDQVRTIALKERIAAVAPKLIAQSAVNGKPVAVIGVVWPEEMEIKSYWAITGRQPDSPWQVLAGAKAAQTLGLPDDSLRYGGSALDRGRGFGRNRLGGRQCLVRRPERRAGDYRQTRPGPLRGGGRPVFGLSHRGYRGPDRPEAAGRGHRGHAEGGQGPGCTPSISCSTWPFP